MRALTSRQRLREHRPRIPAAAERPHSPQDTLVALVLVAAIRQGHDNEAHGARQAPVTTFRRTITGPASAVNGLIHVAGAPITL